MLTISREEFEELIERNVKKTGLPEELVRREVETVIKIKGYEIEEPNIESLATHFVH